MKQHFHIHFLTPTWSLTYYQSWTQTAASYKHQKQEAEP